MLLSVVSVVLKEPSSPFWLKKPTENFSRHQKMSKDGGSKNSHIIGFPLIFYRFDYVTDVMYPKMTRSCQSKLHIMCENSEI